MKNLQDKPLGPTACRHHGRRRALQRLCLVRLALRFRTHYAVLDLTSNSEIETRGNKQND